MDERREQTDLGAAAEERYLSYALSVITSRALPDVRDGLKPVQRRILFAMFQNLRLGAGAKPRKSAQIVGEVIGKYHPHGDVAAYDAMVRMAQDFSLRYPLVHGEGNFGSLDGDSPAAYRYTEARLTAIAEEMLAELESATVDWRPTYDATYEEPVVLPSRLPQLLMNGSTGIAVGMATNVPPHNLKEISDALVALVDDPEIEVKDLLKYVKGPDFPTGGEILSTRAELRGAYESGQGQLRIRGEYKLEKLPRGREQIVVTSIPYAVNKATLIEQIAALINERKLPQIADVRDESTTDVRIVLELRPDASADAAMAYVFKHTDLQVSFYMNLTVLRPAEHTAVGQPGRASLKDLCRDFLDFRMIVVVRRLEHEREKLEARLHVLEGFATIYGALDRAIRLIRGAENRADATAKLMQAFSLDQVQVDAILELRLYQLARLEIARIQEERAEKRKRLGEVRRLLERPRERWKVIRSELIEIRDRYGDARRTKVFASGREDLAYDPDAYVVHEETTVLVSRDGWIRRVREIKDPASTRLREGDAVQTVLPATTRDRVAFFSSKGVVYVLAVADVPATTGYGEPVQSFFRRRRRAGRALAPRASERTGAGRRRARRAADLFDGGRAPRPRSARGLGPGLRLPGCSRSVRDDRAGRRFARVAESDDLLVIDEIRGDEVVCLGRSGKGVRFALAEVNELSGVARGVILMRLDAGDRLAGAATVSARTPLVAILEGGGERPLKPDSFPEGRRGNKGHKVVKRGVVARLDRRAD
jgi:DNA gyrase subunit A